MLYGRGRIAPYTINDRKAQKDNNPDLLASLPAHEFVNTGTDGSPTPNYK